MRKPILYFLVLLFFLASACNFPIKSLQGRPEPTQTVGAAILATREQPAPVLQPPSPTLTLQALPTTARPLEYDPDLFVAYAVQSGDTLNGVAAHFGVTPDQIRSAGPLPTQGLLPNRQRLIIPKLPEPAPLPRFLLSDSEVVNSPCGRSFNIREYVNTANGRLRTYAQIVDGANLTGAEVVQSVAENTSLNPRFLLAFVEYRSHWVLGNPTEPNLTHPLGLNIAHIEGLYFELTTYAQLVNIGYYAWREGKMTELNFVEGGTARIAPELNAGSVALQYLFARSFSQSRWEAELYGANGFLSIYQKMFGDAQACARGVEPLFPDALSFPTLELPFAPGEAWVLTGGLHSNWDVGTPFGALDFAPVTGEPPCTVSRAWVLAAAAGVVTRSAKGVLQLALVDGAGKASGWELLYMHIAEKERIAVGTRVMTDDRIGHPSCEGGMSSGTHVHLARMYRGEWIGAGDAFPYRLSGWLAVPGKTQYQSTLVKGDQVVVSRSDGSKGSWIIR